MASRVDCGRLITQIQEHLVVCKTKAELEDALRKAWRIVKSSINNTGGPPPCRPTWSPKKPLAKRHPSICPKNRFRNHRQNDIGNMLAQLRVSDEKSGVVGEVFGRVLTCKTGRNCNYKKRFGSKTSHDEGFFATGVAQDSSPAQ